MLNSIVDILPHPPPPADTVTTLNEDNVPIQDAWKLMIESFRVDLSLSAEVTLEKASANRPICTTMRALTRPGPPASQH